MSENQQPPLFLDRIITLNLEILNNDFDINSIFNFMFHLLEPFIMNGFRRDNHCSFAPFDSNKKHIQIKLFRKEDFNASSFNFEKVRDFVMKEVCAFRREHGNIFHVIITNY